MLTKGGDVFNVSCTVPFFHWGKQNIGAWWNWHALVKVSANLPYSVSFLFPHHIFGVNPHWSQLQQHFVPYKQDKVSYFISVFKNIVWMNGDIKVPENLFSESPSQWWTQNVLSKLQQSWFILQDRFSVLKWAGLGWTRIRI